MDNANFTCGELLRARCQAVVLFSIKRMSNTPWDVSDDEDKKYDIHIFTTKFSWMCNIPLLQHLPREHVIAACSNQGMKQILHIIDSVLIGSTLSKMTFRAFMIFASQWNFAYDILCFCNGKLEFCICFHWFDLDAHSWYICPLIWCIVSLWLNCMMFCFVMATVSDHIFGLTYYKCTHQCVQILRSHRCCITTFAIVRMRLRPAST